jgi:cytochrome c oxidase cbb3-type subunit 3
MRLTVILTCLPMTLPMACEREERAFRVTGTTPDESPYQGNAWATAQGKRLYLWMNCVGCHANGGGGMGPPLMDAAWRYGSDPRSVYASIAEGRPNGMPSFKKQLTQAQLWQLVEYVRSLAGLTPPVQRPGRSDTLEVRAPEYQLESKAPHPEVPK